MENEQKQLFLPQFPKVIQGFKLVVEVGAVLAVIGNLWLLPKLAPLATNDVVIIARVEALEEITEKQQLGNEDIKVLRTELENIKKDVTEIKSDIKFLLRESR